MVQLLKALDETQTLLKKAKEEKFSFEMNILDLNSKDTQTKQYTKLHLEHPEYGEMCSKVSSLENELNLVEKTLSMVKHSAHMFSDSEHYNKFCDIIYESVINNGAVQGSCL